MSEAKRQDTANRNHQAALQDPQPKNNPFSVYVGANNQSPPERESDRNTKERQRASDSDRDRSSRSRSRERRPKDSRPEYEHMNQPYYNQEIRRGPYNPPPKKQENKEEAYFKTKICPLFQKVQSVLCQGECNKGSACSFAHGQKQVRGLPNFRKTRLCLSFKNGECPKSSNDCKYAHGQAEIRKLAYDYFPQRNNEHKYDRPDRPERPQRQDRYQRHQRHQRYERSDRHERQRYDRYERNDRGDRERERDRERGDRSDRGDRGDRHEKSDRYERSQRTERSDRQRSYRDKYREQQSSKDRQRDRSYQSKDYGSRSSQAPSSYPPGYGPYISSYSNPYFTLDNAYMIPPSGNFAQGQLYPSSTSHSTSQSGAAYGSMQGQGSYAPPYNMGPYEYGYGYPPQNYPPFNPSSV